MTKQIKAHELAEIITGLLINPEILGEGMTVETHQEFMRSIGEVVAEFCGGEVSGIFEHEGKPTLGIEPNDCLASKEECVWSAYDPLAWLEGDVLGETEKAEKLYEVNSLRSKIRELLLTKALEENEPVNFSHTIFDWETTQEDGITEPGDETPFRASWALENQSWLSIRKEGEEVLAAMIEINRGVPLVRIDAGADKAAILVKAAQGGLVITPCSNTSEFEAAQDDRHSYHDPRAIVIKG